MHGLEPTPWVERLVLPAFILALILLFVSCAATSEVVVRACLETPPPNKGEWRVHVCPQFAVCLEEDDVRALVTEIQARRDWDQQAWLECGPPGD